MKCKTSFRLGFTLLCYICAIYAQALCTTESADSQNVHKKFTKRGGEVTKPKAPMLPKLGNGKPARRGPTRNVW